MTRIRPALPLRSPLPAPVLPRRCSSFSPAGAGAPPPYTPPPVNQKISRLMGVIDNFSGPPTSRQLADIDECAAQLQKGLDEVAKLDGDVPKLNKLMQDAGVPYITLDPASVPAAPTGGRGGQR